MSRRKTPPTDEATTSAPQSSAPAAGSGATRPAKNPTICRIHWGGKSVVKKYNKRAALRYTDVPAEHYGLYKAKMERAAKHGKSEHKHIVRLELR